MKNQVIDYAMRIMMKKSRLIRLLLLIPLSAFSQEVSIVRDSQYEWTCETDQGEVISGHTRQDKAFQSCINASFSSSKRTIVRGGTFRVETTAPTTPPPDPGPDPIPPDPDPVPPDPEPKPQVTFGPVTSLTEYPATIGALKQNTFRWEITFTLNSLPTTGRMGLASRDQSGTLQVGHLSLYVEPNGVLILRHQDACPNCGGSGESFKLIATTAIQAGEEYTVVASMSSSQGTSLWVEGVMEAHDPRSWGLDKNNLPLIVGGLCTICKPNDVPPIGPRYPIDGTVFMAIYDDALPLPQLSGHVTLRWEMPTHYVPTEEQKLAGLPGDPIKDGDIAKTSLFRDGQWFVDIDPDVLSHEVTNLMVGQEYCFTGTVTTGNCCGTKESIHSEPVCRTP